MATLALSLAGQVAGGLVGGPLGATIGRALGALAGSAIDGMLFGETAPSAANDVRLQYSSEGGAVPRLYGWSRLAGNIIWARELETIGGEGGGAKGFGGSDVVDAVGASFAVAFCEGEVHRLGRIWADGQILDTEGLTLRFYRGTEDQLPDGLIEATQGEVPAYRGLCYLVVEQLPLARFGNRIPQLTVELCRVVGDLERDLRAVTVIPGATEFGYDPSPRVRLVRPGETAAENTHMARHISDWSWSIDELTALCPNLEHVALVVTWFGNDLRAGACTVAPRVEAVDREVRGAAWSVAGQGRGEVAVVSSHGGGAAYGGTPSDDAVLAAIADLKARGLGVTLYPLIMMDVPAGNGLPDPYGGAAQAAYPWRGRITCHPAPGQAGSPDQTDMAAEQVAVFAAQMRGMVLHYAGLAAAAGGVDAFIIGSEMRGLSTVRGADNSFPFVAALVSLAETVRSVVGPDTRLTYAADWSEYSGYQPDGEKFFHLDPLWASPDIDAVGIDNYMPLADWRDGVGHADAALAKSGHDRDYLAANIAGGEGYDWYYASAADRLAQVRTPIVDGTHGEPWVWRYKDIRNWWSQSHHDRPGGVRTATPTAWVPASKPIWMTELGCGAVDKGANQPNIFGDAKSAEGGRPYFSTGRSDGLVQRQFLRAHQAYWRNEDNNPPGMVDPARLYCWTWDARPYPAFPGLPEVWADSVNHRTGHWLTGRLGAMASDELTQAVAADHGVTLEADAVAPLIGGYVLNRASSGRDALEMPAAIAGMSFRNHAGNLRLGAPHHGDVLPIEVESLAAGDGPILSRRRGDSGEAAGRLALSFFDREADYKVGTVTALLDAAGPLAEEAVAMTLEGQAARLAAERLLDARGTQRETLTFELPPQALAVEPGDLVSFAELAEGPFEITEIRDGSTRRITALSVTPPRAVAVDDDAAPRPALSGTARALPLVFAAQLPPLPGDGRTRLVLAAHARPWPGVVQVVEAVTGATVAELRTGAAIGVLASDLAPGSTALWNRQSVNITLWAGHLASVEALAALAGSNRLAVETGEGKWEVIGFAEAELIEPGRYRLSRLLRGLQGSLTAAVDAGARVIVLDKRVVTLPVEPHWLGETRSLLVHAGRQDVEGIALDVTLGVGPARPLPPAHLSAQRHANGDVFLRWTRRSAADGDGWGLADAPLDHAPEGYRVTVFGDDEPVRSVDVASPGCTYSAAQQTADFGGLPASFQFTVAQLSPTLGIGHLAQGAFA